MPQAGAELVPLVRTLTQHLAAPLLPELRIGDDWFATIYTFDHQLLKSFSNIAIAVEVFTKGEVLSDGFRNNGVFRSAVRLSDGTQLLGEFLR